MKMHRFIQNNNGNTHAAYTGKTYKNNCIIYDATQNLTHNFHLSLIKIPPTTCIPSTFLPALYHTAQNSQQWVTPKLRLNSNRIKEFLTSLMYLRKLENLCHRCQLELIAYSPSLPTCLSHPTKCAPSLLNSPSTTPFPFQGFNNKPDMKSQSLVAGILTPFGKQFP
jgi:hypothetical protein